MDDNKSNSQDIEEEFSEKTEKSEASQSKHSKVPEESDGENKSQHSGKENDQIDNKEEEIDNGNEHVEQKELYEKTLETLNRSRPSSMVSNKPSRPSSPFVSKSVNFDLKTKRKNSTSRYPIKKDFYLSAVNDTKYIGDQFKVGKIDPHIKSPFEEKFEKRYSKTLKKLTANSTIGNFNETQAFYNQKKLLDPKYTLVNELKFKGEQFKLGRPDTRSKSPFEERFQKKFKQRLEVLLPNPNRMQMAFSYDELKQIHNNLAISRKIPAK